MKKRNLICSYLYCLIISFLFLMLCSKNSFLYQMNDWVDANAFFTVGKGMVRGILPYQQLFEQKGPLLYLIYGIGSLISYKSFIGVFVLEVLSFSIFLYYAYKTLILFIEKEKAYLVLPIFTLFIVTLKSFSHGGSAEEFSFPFLMISLYYLIRYLKNNTISKKVVFSIGLLAGCILWLKYTLLGFWFSWMMSIFFLKISKKQYKEGIIDCFIFLGGMLIATVPWLIYFGFHHALFDMINVYFLVNIQAYPHKLSIVIKLFKTFQLILLNLFGNPIMFLWIIGGFYLLFIEKKKWGCKGSNFILLICLLFTGFGVYIGGTNYHYYPLIMAPFLLLGFIAVLRIVTIKVTDVLSIYILPLLMICLLSAYYTSSNTFMLRYEKSDYAQYHFAKIMKQEKNSTILNYGFLDGGFYLTMGQIPKFYYFMKNNIPYENYPEMLDEQRRYIQEQLPDFVIAKDSLKLKTDFIHQYYKVVATHTQRYQTKDIQYVLFQRRQ